MGEIRTIDDQQGIGARSNNGIRRLADAQNQLWQTREHLREAHDRKFGIIEQRFQAFALKTVAANADKLDITPALCTQCPHQICAKKIARYLAGNDRQLVALSAHAFPR
jgi:hypothetical protein